MPTVREVNDSYRRGQAAEQEGDLVQAKGTYQQVISDIDTMLERGGQPLWVAHLPRRHRAAHPRALLIPGVLVGVGAYYGIKGIIRGTFLPELQALRLEAQRRREALS